jgi:N-methylhydantoinase B
MRFSGVKVIRGGEIDPEWAEFIAHNVRAPEAVLNDLRSMIAAQNTGQQRLTALLDEIGLEEFQHYSELNKAASERLVRQRFADLPDGTYSSKDWVEYDGHGTPELYEVACTLEIAGDEATFHFSGHEQVPCFINATTPVMYGQTMTTLMCQLLYDVPVNQGLWRPIHFDLGPPGTIVNAVVPAPTTQGHMETGARVNKLVTDVLSQAASLSNDPAIRARAAGQPGNATVSATLTGISRRTGKPTVVFPMSPPHCLGSGAFTSGDGLDTYGQQCTPGQRVPAVEIEESTSPLRILWRRLLPDSAGAGIHRGGLGAIIAMAVDGADTLRGAAFNSVAEVPARGFAGGLPASAADYYVLRETKMSQLLDAGVLPTESNLGGRIERLPSKVGSLTVSENDAFIFRSSGGGGLGDPLLRPMEAVGQDVVDGYVSEHAAREFYGVVVRHGKVDTAATDELREAIRRRRLGHKADRETVLSPVDIANFASAVGKTSDGEWLCRYCGTTLGAAADYRELAVATHRPLYDYFVAHGMQIRARADPATQVRLSEYYCPSCGYRLTADVAADSFGIDVPASGTVAHAS